MKFVTTKKSMITNFFSPLSFVTVFGSGIRDGQKSGSGIRDKHPGSATLQELLKFIPKKLSPSPQKYGFGIRDPRFRIRKKPIPDPGSRGQKTPDPGSGSATLPFGPLKAPNPVKGFEFYCDKYIGSVRQLPKRQFFLKIR